MWLFCASIKERTEKKKTVEKKKFHDFFFFKKRGGLIPMYTLALFVMIFEEKKNENDKYSGNRLGYVNWAGTAHPIS